MRIQAAFIQVARFFSFKKPDIIGPNVLYIEANGWVFAKEANSLNFQLEQMLNWKYIVEITS